LAAKYLRRQAKQLEDQLDGIHRAEDIEFVHRARVASRRLRAALGMFGIALSGNNCADGASNSAAFHRTWVTPAIRTCKSNSSAERCRRLASQAAIRASPGCWSTWSGSGNYCKPRGQGEQAAARSKVLKEMQRVAKRTLAGLGAEELAAQKETARAASAPHIRRRLDRTLSTQHSLRNAEAKRQHHAMRIAAKHLRYTLEMADSSYEKRLTPFIESARKVQTLLGDVHDCDVWLDQLDAFAAPSAARCAHISETTRALPASRRASRIFARIAGRAAKRPSANWLDGGRNSSGGGIGKVCCACWGGRHRRWLL